MELPKFKEMNTKQKVGVGTAIAAVSAAVVLGGVAFFTSANTVKQDPTQQDDKFVMAEWELTDVANRVSASDSEIRMVVEQVLKENGFDLTSEEGLNEAAISYIQAAVQQRITESLANYDASSPMTGEEITALETAIADDVYNILVEEKKVSTDSGSNSGSGSGTAGSSTSGKQTTPTVVTTSGVSEQTARAISQQIASSTVTSLNAELNSLKTQVDAAQKKLDELSSSYSNGKSTTSGDLTTLQNTLNSVPKTASSIDSQSYTQIRSSVNTLVQNLSDFMDTTEADLADVSLQLSGKVTSTELNALKSDYEAYVEEMKASLDTVKTDLVAIEESSGDSLADVNTLIEELQEQMTGSIDTIKALDEKNLNDLKNTLIEQIKANKNLSDEQARLLASQIAQMDIDSAESIEQLREQLTTYIDDNKNIITEVINGLSVDTTKNLADLKTDLKSQIDSNTSLTEGYKTYLKGLIDQLDENTASSMGSIKTFLQDEIDDTTARLSNTASTLNDTITSVNKRLGVLETKSTEQANDLIQTVINQIMQDPTLTEAEKEALIAMLRNMDPDDASSLEAIKAALARMQNQITTHIDQAIDNLTVTPGADIDQTKTELRNQVNGDSSLSAEERQILLEMINNLDDSVAGDIAKVKEALKGMLANTKAKYENSGDGVKSGESHLQDELNLTMEQLTELARQTNLDLQGVLAMIGNSYTPTFLYHDGSYCVYDKELYRCTENLSVPEEFNPDHWEKVDLATELASAKDMISDQFSTAKDYEKGDIVVYDNKLYECTADTVSSGSAFNSSQWRETTVSEALNNNLSGIDIRYNAETEQPEWSIRGADSWNPFKKQVSSSYIGEVAVGETKDLGNQYDFLIVQPLLKDRLTYELTQVIDVANEPSGSFYYAAYAYATGASGNRTWTDNYYNSCRSAGYTISEDASTGNTVLTINSGSGVIVSGMKASEMNLLGRFSSGATVDTTGYSAIAVVKEVGSVSYRHLLLQGDMGEGKDIPNITTGFTQVYSGRISVDYFTSAALYDWVSDGAKDFFTAPYDCKVYGIM